MGFTMDPACWYACSMHTPGQLSHHLPLEKLHGMLSFNRCQ